MPLYKYNEEMALGDKINYGFLAQDILEAFGEDYNFVVKDKNSNYYKVNYYQLISPLVSMVQEQQKEIELLKNEINKLKEKDIL
jgi:hypothetical protein